MSLNNLPNQSQSYWLAETTSDQYPKLTESIKTDICIVGGGITGITAALLLLKSGFKVTLIDSDRLFGLTSGHTTGKITAQHGLIYDQLLSKHGKEQADQYYRASETAKGLIKSFIDEYQIDCDFMTETAYVYTNSREYMEQIRNEYEAYEKIGIDGFLTESIPLDIPHHVAIGMKNQAQFHPVKYLNSLVKQSVELGLQIYESTRAIDVEYSKKIAVITENNERIFCKYVIQATQYPFFDGGSFFPLRLHAGRSYALSFKTTNKWPGGMYINAESPKRSIRKINDQLWLVAGENHKTGQGNQMENHYHNLHEFSEKHFPIETITNRWSAQDYTTLDTVPYIGLLNGQRNIYIATGFNKWGMTQGTMAGKIISDIINEQDNEFIELYTPKRFKVNPSLKNALKENIDVTKHLVEGKLNKIESDVDINELPKDTAVKTKIDNNKTGIYKSPTGEIFAVDTTCTHLGCETVWNNGEKTWDCPCHGSRFSYEGIVIEGPAKKPLTKIKVPKE